MAIERMPLTRRYAPPSPQRGEGTREALPVPLPPLAPLGRGWLGAAETGEGRQP